MNLLPAGGRSPAGDSPEMLAARDAFLAGGHFAPIATALIEAIAPSTATVVDVGAGTGWYLAAVLDALPGARGLALDASKYAARRASRAHPRARAVVCDTWTSLPVRDGSADLVLDVFAPRNGAEMARVLAPGGQLLVVTPTERHLAELAEPLGLLAVDPLKRDRLTSELAPLMATATTQIEFAMPLDRAAVRALVAMGPSARHGEPTDRDVAITNLPEPVEVTASVLLTRFVGR